MNSPRIYIKKDHTCMASDKFMYSDEIYRIEKNRAYLIQEKYYTSSKTLNVKVIPVLKKFNGCIIQRFFELIGAPEEYLINNGYKYKKL